MKKDDLSRLAPKLSSIEKQDLYQIPDGTFDDLPYAIQMALPEKIKLSPVEKVFKVISIGITTTIILLIFIISYQSFFTERPAPVSYDKAETGPCYPNEYGSISNYLAFE